MAKLVIDNLYSYLTETPEEIVRELHKHLRFPIKDRHFNPLVASRQWDGFVDFFKEKTGRFLTGLLPEIQMATRSYGLDLEIEDKRKLVEFNVQDISSDFLGNNITLRDYQCDYVRQVIKHQRAVIPAPTGSGKSLTLVALLKALKEKTPTLVLANRVDLVEQNYEEIIKCGIPNVGRFHGKVKQPDWITCATVQSCDKLAPIFPRIRALIVDEIHDMMTKECKHLYNRCPNAALRMAMSATAFKHGGKDLVQKFEVKGYFGPLLKTKFSETGMMTTKELQGRDILSKAISWFITVDRPKLEYVVYNDAINLGISESEYFQDLVVNICKRLKGRTIILVERVKQGDILAEKLKNAFWVSGKDNTKTRKEVIKKLKYGEGDCVALATRHIFNTGIDFRCHNLVNAASGTADHLIVQRFGRGLRRSDDKEMLNYIDFYFTNNEYLQKHSKDRINILKKEGHNVEVFNHADLDKLPWT